MEVEYTKELVPEIKRVIESFTMVKERNETRPFLLDSDGNRISHQEWYTLAYAPRVMTRYEFQLYEEWREDVDSLKENEYEVVD